MYKFISDHIILQSSAYTRQSILLKETVLLEHNSNDRLLY